MPTYTGRGMPAAAQPLAAGLGLPHASARSAATRRRRARSDAPPLRRAPARRAGRAARWPRNGRMSSAPCGPPKATTRTASNGCGTSMNLYAIILAPRWPPTLVARAATARRRPRLVSLDVFRGLTMAAMVIVNNPGDWGNVYAPLLHAEWNGWTPTDLIFPFFLFIVGVSITLSRKSASWRRDPPARRDHLRARPVPRRLSALRSVARWRIPGVLQRIAHLLSVRGRPRADRRHDPASTRPAGSGLRSS